MKIRFPFVVATLALALVFGCSRSAVEPEEPVDPSDQTDTTATDPAAEPEEHQHGAEPSWEPSGLPSTCGISYLYDETVLPEIHLEVPLEQWDTLLVKYDENKKTNWTIHCDVAYVKGNDTTRITDSGMKLHGNTSRRRPEGSSGNMHRKDDTDWKHVHLTVNFRKWQKDDDHEVHGARKVMLKYMNGDATYVREMYAFDLFRRAGVWTGVNDAYCKLYIHVAGDSKEAYYGIYEMLEPIDSRYLKVRSSKFGGKDGNIWKCSNGATLNDFSASATFGADLDTDDSYTYELKTNQEDYDAALEQLNGFIWNLNHLSDSEFHDWIQEVCDVPFLLKTYAVNVALGMWDDYWNNSNNYYLYFNSTNKDSYKVYLIPYDYDNCLGTSLACGVQLDSGWQSPFKWGQDSHPFLARLMKFDDFKETYRQYLLEVIAEENHLLWYECSDSRIKRWQAMISPYLSNDTHENQSISDKPAGWGNRSSYRIMDPSSGNNFFKVKAQSIHKYCDE